MKSSLIQLAITLIVACIFLIIQVKTGVDVPDATRVLKSSGYKPIEVGGYGLFQSGSDWYSTKFKAVSITGDTVTGVVSKGLWFKGSTVRLN